MNTPAALRRLAWILAATGLLPFFAHALFVWVAPVSETTGLIRSQVLTIKERQFVDRARAIGAGHAHIVRQHILPHGTSQEVRDHVKEVIRALGSYGGGLIGHGEIAPDVPLDNLEALFQAAHE